MYKVLFFFIYLFERNDYMKQIIPFKKELLFKTKVSEITSISLEHTLTLKNDDLISGEFNITGDYKMTEGSINRENFQFKLPFDITLDSRYNLSSIVIDIDNFYYEIINNEALLVNIDVYIEGTKLEDIEPIIKENNSKLEDIIEEENADEALLTNINTSLDNELDVRNTPLEKAKLEKEMDMLEEEFIPVIDYPKINNEQLDVKQEIPKEEFNLFDNIDTSDTYVTYHVYIVKENDTLETVMNKYQTTKESIATYNNIEDIKPGTKLIIPSSNE